jgi:tight adherence protein C
VTPAAFDPAALPAGALLWSALLALSVYALVTAQPLGKPRPDLGERLRRLDVDARIRMDLARRESRPIFASRVLEGILRPVIDDVGRLLRALLARFGLDGGAGLERKLRLARPGVEPAQFTGEKVVAGVVVMAVVPFMNAAGVQPFGAWPAWAWLVGFAVGYLLPDAELERRVAAQRTACLMELPTVLDMLTIATSAGLALEQAVARVAEQGSGAVARELRRVCAEVALGHHRSVVTALEAMAERNGVPELTRFVGHLRGAHDQGIPLVEALATQADALREQKRVRIVAEGGKASVRMVIPVALFILPTLFVVLLVPAATEVMRLGG